MGCGSWVAGQDGQVALEMVWCVTAERLGPRILAPLSRAAAGAQQGLQGAARKGEGQGRMGRDVVGDFAAT